MFVDRTSTIEHSTARPPRSWRWKVIRPGPTAPADRGRNVTNSASLGGA